MMNNAMKLYATTTSERASKGQGGNKHIELTLQGGEYRDILIRFEVNYNKDFPNYSIKMIDGDINFIQVLKNHLSFYLDIQKGKKQKTATVEYHENARYIDCKLKGTDYCDKCGYTNR